MKLPPAPLLGGCCAGRAEKVHGRIISIHWLLRVISEHLYVFLVFYKILLPGPPLCPFKYLFICSCSPHLPSPSLPLGQVSSYLKHQFQVRLILSLQPRPWCIKLFFTAATLASQPHPYRVLAPLEDCGGKKGRPKDRKK
ncbi:hypothetical protein E2C01_062423 [Portunus trituberculatus]|uniref:Uncharacterized protein n=1 Tax=Portunus trituberculatus TaxID=210409 RepID=A0A5B7HF96_PORTR|nr:hypothetical protein [Portunus trituberculatus]